MTVVVKTPEGQIKVMCKGADSVIAARIQENELNISMMKEIDQHLDKYAGSGLRTLLLAEKIISDSDYEAWK